MYCSKLVTFIVCHILLGLTNRLLAFYITELIASVKKFMIEAFEVTFTLAFLCDLSGYKKLECYIKRMQRLPKE